MKIKPLLRFIDSVSICLIDKINDNYNETMYDDVKCVEQIMFLTCVNSKESQLWKRNDKNFAVK